MMVYNPDEIEKDYEEYNGGCWKCNKQLTLKDNQINCDNCGELIRWNCNSCHNNFEIVNKKDRKKLSCDNNCTWVKGKNKGQIVQLKERLNNCDTCQMYRGNFKKKNSKT